MSFPQTLFHRPWRALFGLSLALCVTLSWSLPANATGLLITKDPARRARVRALRALMHFGRDRFALHLQLALQSEDRDVAWIIPVPLADAKDLSVLITSLDLMQSLEKLTAPLIEINSVGNRTGCGRPSSTKPLLPPNAPVSVSSIFEATKLALQPVDISYTSDDKVSPHEQMTSWLQQEGFALSAEQDKQLKALAEQRTVQFVMVHIRFEDTTNEVRSLEPVLIRTPRLVPYPEWTLPLSLTPTTEDFPAIFYTLGQRRYGITNKDFVEKSLQEIGAEVRKQYDSNGQASYELALQEATKAANNKLFVPEFKQAILTLCPPEQTENDPNYTICQNFQDVVSLTEKSYDQLTRLRSRFSTTTPLPDLTFYNAANQEDISGRVLASIHPSTSPASPQTSSFRRNTALAQHSILLQDTSAPSQTALLWLLGLFALLGLSRRPQKTSPSKPKHRAFTWHLLPLLLCFFSLQACDCFAKDPRSLLSSPPKKVKRKLPKHRNLPLHRLTLPPGFKIDLFANKVPFARSLARGPKGTIFVGTRVSGAVYALVDENKDGKADRIYTLLTGRKMPNGVAMRGKDLYVAEIHRILRLDKIEDHLARPPKPKVIFDSYPDKTHHGWKFIRFGPDGYLYVPVGAPCNICNPQNPIFASITRIKPDGTGIEIFAHGIRNSVGFDWHPVTRELWFTDNGRDWLGDERPPCELNHAPQKGLHFGYPFCHGSDIADPKYGKLRSCKEFRPPAHAMRAHTAPLGMRFYTGKMFPSTYHHQIFVAQHGSWNRSRPIGYRVMNAFLKDNKVVAFKPFLEGFLYKGRPWGRPVDVLNMPDGSILVSDDYAGAIYRITYAKP